MRRLPPATVLVYVLKWVVILLVALITAYDNPIVVAAVVLMILALTGLWRGSRVAWVLLLILEASLLISAPFTDSPWWVIPLSIFALGLLAAPATRDHVDRARASGSGSA